MQGFLVESSGRSTSTLCTLMPFAILIRLLFRGFSDFDISLSTLPTRAIYATWLLQGLGNVVKGANTAMVAENQYVRRTTKSREMFERAKKVEPAGVSYRNRLYEPYPFFVKEANGTTLVDLDGNKYTDYWCTHFAMILGHMYPSVLQAIKAQAEKGWHFGVSHELEVMLSEKIVRDVPSAQLVRFSSSGSEANLFAVRLARTFTKRNKIAKFEGCWHGAYDALHIAVKPPFDKPSSGGITEGSQKDTIVVPYNDITGFVNRTRKEDLACVILEPVLGAGGMIPAEKEFLQEVREYCDSKGTLLIYDEVITGFRLGLGGAQQHFGVKPDITVLGKIIGGGLPIGAVCGRRDVMERMDHTRFSGLDYAYHGGTFAGNAITATAGLATIEVLEHSPVYQHIDALGKKARDGLDHLFSENRFEAQTSGIGSLFAIHTTRKQPLKDANNLAFANTDLSRSIFSYLLDNGIFMLSPDSLHGGISYSHTDSDIERLVTTVGRYVKEKGR
jgi:glutamate-1-semialdehyde 2,1-aminomutase